MIIFMECIVCILQMLVFTSYIKELLGLRKSVYWMPLCWLVLEGSGRLLEQCFEMTGANSFIYFVLLSSIAVIMCKGDWKKKIFATIAYVVLSSAIEVVLVGVLMLFKVCDMESLLSDPMLTSQLIVLDTMLLFICFRLFFSLGKRWIKVQEPVHNWLGIFGVSVSCFAAMFIVGLDMYNYQKFTIGKLLVMCILIGLNFLSYYFYSVSAENEKMALETRVYQEQISVYQEWYEDIQQVRREMKAFRHDMKNHFNVLKNMCAKGNNAQEAQYCLQEINKYISEFDVGFQDDFEETDSGNLVIDSIINAKKSLAAIKGIKMTLSLTVPRHMDCNGTDVVILLANLLDNAIEACEAVKNTEKEITFSIDYASCNLIICICNTYSGNLDGQSGSSSGKRLLPTTKSDSEKHGIGMQNVLSVVDKYKGTMEWKAESGWFQVDLLLYKFIKMEEKAEV